MRNTPHWDVTNETNHQTHHEDTVRYDASTMQRKQIENNDHRLRTFSKMKIIIDTKHSSYADASNDT